jgi:hypothetical protein
VRERLQSSYTATVPKAIPILARSNIGYPGVKGHRGQWQARSLLGLARSLLLLLGLVVVMLALVLMLMLLLLLLYVDERAREKGSSPCK